MTISPIVPPEEMAARVEALAQRQETRDAAPPLPKSGGGGTSGGMEERVTRLEAHMEYVRRDFAEIKDSLKVLPTLATKRDLAGSILAGLGLGFAIMAIVIGGVIGGLGWLQSRVPAPTPAASTPLAPPTK